MPYALVLLLIAGGCSLFETRSAEPPDGAVTGVFMQPDRADVVLDNLVNAIENLNTQNYLRNLHPDLFEYNPSLPALESNPELWARWSRDEEQLYFNNLRAAAENTTGHQLRLSNISSESISVSEQQIVADYSLTLIHNRANVGVPTSITGRFVLVLESGEDGLWSIVRWSDVGAGQSFSWSDLRASFLVD
ncbi:MAG: hypothetical protein JJU41_04465 [Bacteroidetes bacterium]|nr:hypothetical protein [Bacteroidota bacterium]MCH8524619.1 hypothetical protein [Balneolales bacterium]